MMTLNLVNNMQVKIIYIPIPITSAAISKSPTTTGTTIIQNGGTESFEGVVVGVTAVGVNVVGKE